MNSRWQRVAKEVAREEWGTITVFLGLLVTMLSTTLSLPALALSIFLLLLLAYGTGHATIRADRLLREKHVPMIVLVGKGEHVADSMWKDIEQVMGRWGFEAWRYRQEPFDVEREDLFLHREEPLPRDDADSWLKLCRDFRHRMERVSKRLPGRRVFHIFVNGPVSLAIGLGASIGTLYEVVVHQWFPGTTSVVLPK